jgi:hypothetical protein
MNPVTLAALRALVDPGRIRLVGRLAAGPVAATTLAAELRRPLPAVRRDLDLLLAVGLVERGVERAAGVTEPGAETFVARLDRVGVLAGSLAAMAREADGLAPEPGKAWPHDGEPLEATVARLGFGAEERKVLRAYLVDGLIVTIPSRGRKRDVLLRFLRERVFTEDREYPEKEVNQRLALFHGDVAALRRYLVDERMVAREGGRYRRAEDATAGRATVSDAMNPGDDA